MTNAIYWAEAQSSQPRHNDPPEPAYSDRSHPQITGINWATLYHGNRIQMKHFHTKWVTKRSKWTQNHSGGGFKSSTASSRTFRAWRRWRTRRPIDHSHCNSPLCKWPPPLPSRWLMSPFLLSTSGSASRRQTVDCNWSIRRSLSPDAGRGRSLFFFSLRFPN